MDVMRGGGFIPRFHRKSCTPLTDKTLTWERANHGGVVQGESIKGPFAMN